MLSHAPAGLSRKPLILLLVWGLAIVAILPFLFRWPAPPPAPGWGALVRVALGYLAVLAVGYCMYRAELLRLPRRDALVLALFVLLLTAVTCQVHRATVDYGRPVFEGVSNTAWQSGLEDAIIQWSKFDVPHTYRFLPNSIVRWFQIGGFNFETARSFYRLLCSLLLFYAIYRYARLFTNHLGGMIAMLLTAIVLPVSYENYGGQLNDPLSHLSFVLAFIFLETEEFAYLLATVVIGSLAKEAILPMAGYYVLFGRKQKGYPLKAAALCAGGAAVALVVRYAVLKGGPMGYGQISGTTLKHVWTNLSDTRWPLAFLLTAGAYMPFLALRWKETPATLRWLVVYWLPVIFVSSAFFSWLAEARNFMPVVFVLAVIAGCHLSKSVEARP